MQGKIAICRALHAPPLFRALKLAFMLSPQLGLISIAPYILLTRPAALGFMAQFIAHVGLAQYSDQTAHPSGRPKIYQIVDGVRLLGMPAATALSCNSESERIVLVSQVQATFCIGISCFASCYVGRPHLDSS